MMGEGEGKGELRGDDRWRDIVAEGRCGVASYKVCKART
jgi:hypothetical protein